ncbi:MAG: phosphatase PAP2 family protein [Spirochaetaceae bacterium]|nr:phosphatase PAP2 family protein [Spirochaetaceae bacterium]
MDALYTWGIAVIQTIQQIANPFLTTIIKGITFLGDPIFYIIILALFYWNGSKQKAFKLGFTLLISASVNTAIKYALKVPRPFYINKDVGLIFEKGYSTPSGHAQGSATFWIMIANLFRHNQKKWPIVTAIFMPILIGLTRIYLGVHYPTDVMLGWVLGSLIAFTLIIFWEPVRQKTEQLPLKIKILLFALITVILNAITPLDTSLNGAFFGLCLGYTLYTAKVKETEKTYEKKWGIILARNILGLFLIAGIYFGLKIAFSYAPYDLHNLLRFVRYFAVGFFTSFVIPRLYNILKLD